MIENAPPGRRGLSGAIGGAGYAVGIQLASLTALACASLLSPAELQAWGWRIPFWLSLVVALAGFYVRRTLKDLPQPAAAERPSPLAEVFANHLPLVLRIAGLSAFAAIGFQAAFIYIADWLQRVGGASPADTFKVTSVSMLLVTPVSVFFGWLADHVGRRNLLLASAALGVLGSVPFFMLMQHNTTTAIYLGQAGFVLALSVQFGVQGALMVETTPEPIRCTALAIGNNIAWSILGGLTPLAATWLIYAHRRRAQPGLSDRRRRRDHRRRAAMSPRTISRTQLRQTDSMAGRSSNVRVIAGGSYRQPARMVRFRDLRLSSPPRSGAAFFPAEDHGGAGPGRLRHLRHRLPDAAARRRRHRLYRRPLGRRAALTFSVAAMAVPTFLVGVLPGYETLGVMAPILLTVLARASRACRSAANTRRPMVFLVERAPPGRRGLCGAICSCGANAGILLGSATGAALAALVIGRGAVGMGVALARSFSACSSALRGFALRRGIEEAPVNTDGQPTAADDRARTAAAAPAAGRHSRCFVAVGFYLMFLYVVTWLQMADGIAPAHALEINTLSILALMPTCLFTGWLSDRIGRRMTMLIAMAGRHPGLATAVLAAAPSRATP